MNFKEGQEIFYVNKYQLIHGIIEEIWYYPDGDVYWYTVSYGRDLEIETDDEDEIFTSLDEAINKFKENIKNQ